MEGWVRTKKGWKGGRGKEAVIMTGVKGFSKRCSSQKNDNVNFLLDMILVYVDEWVWVGNDACRWCSHC